MDRVGDWNKKNFNNNEFWLKENKEEFNKEDAEEKETNADWSTNQHTRVYIHRQRQTKVTLLSLPPVLRQTASKMLYFPSKLNCQLILMGKWRLSATQAADTQTHTQTAFTPKHTDTNAEFRISPGQLLAAECGMHAGHKEVCAIWVRDVFCVYVFAHSFDQAQWHISSHQSHEGYFWMKIQLWHCI